MFWDNCGISWSVWLSFSFDLQFNFDTVDRQVTGECFDVQLSGQASWSGVLSLLAAGFSVLLKIGPRWVRSFSSALSLSRLSLERRIASWFIQVTRFNTFSSFTALCISLQKFVLSLGRSFWRFQHGAAIVFYIIDKYRNRRGVTCLRLFISANTSSITFWSFANSFSRISQVRSMPQVLTSPVQKKPLGIAFAIIEVARPFLSRIIWYSRDFKIHYGGCYYGYYGREGLGWQLRFLRKLQKD